MAIKQTVTSEYHFNDWLIDARKRDSSYGNCFTPDAAKAVQDYYDQLSDDLGEDIEFDPIAWCCEWTEYDNLKEACEGYDEEQYFGDGQALDDYTTVITLDNGHVLIQEF